DEVEDAAISVPDSGDHEEGGKMKMIVQLVRKCLGVKDIASMRLSLPASLMEPIPNLEYWHYLDRPDLFAAINDSDDAFERMLAVLRFTFSKDLKFVHGRICKPYNSVLGEHFRAHWDVDPAGLPPCSKVDSTRSETVSVHSGASSSTRASTSSCTGTPKSLSTAATSPQLSELHFSGQPVLRVVFLTEQVSHHPPISNYYAACPERGVEMYGTDQISARVAGTSVRIQPGQHNQGIYVRLASGPGSGEEYRITHPAAYVNGLLRGSFYATMCESTIITCSGGQVGAKYRAIIEYKEESWLGRAHFLLEGVIHVSHPSDPEWAKVKAVPRDRVVAEFNGSWRGKIRWRAADFSPHGYEEYQELIDLEALSIVPKTVRSLEAQEPYESRKLWEGVTNHLLNKEYSDATREKVAIEQHQRDLAAERKRKGTQFLPRYFDADFSSGYALLTDKGCRVVEEELRLDRPVTKKNARVAATAA
ncbi:hypothetical protein FISHEDRAFT_43286, partial [Fistulina hepatica ATCC 64428]